MKFSGTQLIGFGALVALFGLLLSGPLGFLIVQLLHPQPAWISSRVFAANYHGFQNIPYYFGFLLVGGMLILAAGHYLNAGNETDTNRLYVFLSVLCTCIFSALVFFNYIAQTVFIHHLASSYKTDYDVPIAMFSMSNPLSICWAIEIFGYGILGVATSLMSAYYRGKSRRIHFLLIANGVTSIAAAVFTVIDINWLLGIAGLTSYILWNVLMIMLMILIYRFCKTQLKQRQIKSGLLYDSKHSTYA
jgi:hypothetical protein